MTVATTVNRWEFTGNGVWNEAAFTGLLFDETHLVVIQITDTGVISTLVLNTDYTVENNYPAPGGKVVFDDPFPDDYRLVVLRVVPLTQLTSFRNLGAFFAESHEDAFDRLTMIVAQLAEALARAPKFDDSSLFADVVFPDPEAGKILTWNDDDELINGAAVEAFASGRQAVSSGVAFVDITFPVARDNTGYNVPAPFPDWNTGVWISNKATTGFRINFSIEAPGSQFVEWRAYA